MLRFLYIIYILFFVVPIFGIITFITAVITIVGCLLGGERYFSFYPGMIWSRLACLLTLCPVKVVGMNHIVKGQSYVFVANHQGVFDIFLIYGFLGVPIKWMMKIGLSKIPLVGAACRAAGFIFVDNSTPFAARRSIQEAERKLKNGASLAIFPEGSRTKNGKVGRFHKGAFQVAFDQKLSIIPITLNGPFKVLPTGAFIIRPHSLEMIIHPPILVDETSSLDQKKLQSYADHARTIIVSGLWDEFK